MKIQADKHRRDVQFTVGDQVLVKLQPYRQKSVRNQSFSKLCRRYYGPFPVTERVGAVAYRLSLPAGSRIHPVFHVSLLKPYRQNAFFHPLLLPTVTWDNHPVTEPMALLRSRTIPKGKATDFQVLVQWSGLSLEDASWVSLTEFAQAFPHFDLEGKLESLRKGGIDTHPEPEIEEGSGDIEIEEVVTVEPTSEQRKEAPRRGSRLKVRSKWINDYHLE
ncbi:uncharacterized protein LOC133298911 [Gastrolobium bilobum]|uniref:uncharacterized protein LOC133298911 n=1 Tax=Gastrolobium bilobum TaxID=150636 RepID=UPI002AB1F8E5|nr:uncharacterized protein LOC133298911 [Gastrolobium bilobum]